MVALLGNLKGIVKPWWLPFDWVFCTIINNDLIIKTIIVKNSNVCNIYGLPVEINNGVVVRVWHGNSQQSVNPTLLEQKNYCEWHLDDDETGAWESACGEMWCFEDGDPKDNSMKYCPFCGRHLTQRGVVEKGET